MADTTITALPTATSAASTDIIPIVQGGITKQLTNTLLFTSPVVAGTATFASAVFTGATTFTATSTFTSPTYFSVNVGVGTTALNLATLSRALSVGSSGASDTAGVELQTAGVLRGYVSASSSGMYVSASSTYPLIFNTNGVERARFDSSGNFGVGTAAPATKLHVSSAVATYATVQSTSAAASATASTYLDMKSDVNVSTTYYRLIRGVDAAGAVRWAVGQNGLAEDTFAVYTGTSVTERMRVDSAGNVGIGATANASAILDAQSTTKGVRFPNMTTAQKTAIASPAAGLVVFDTTLAKLCVYTGSAWQTITSA